MRRIFLAFLSVLIAFSAQAQVFNPVSWQTEVEDLKAGTFALKVTAQIKEGWHLYSQTLPSEDGPIATEFTFPEGDAYTLIGKVEEPKAKTEYDPNFDMDLNYFEKKVTFIQKVKPTSPDGFELTAEVYFMVCDAEKCLPPEYVGTYAEQDADLTYRLWGTLKQLIHKENIHDIYNLESNSSTFFKYKLSKFSLTSNCSALITVLSQEVCLYFFLIKPVHMRFHIILLSFHYQDLMHYYNVF